MPISRMPGTKKGETKQGEKLMTKQKKLFYAEFYKWTNAEGETSVYGGYGEYDQGQYEGTGSDLYPAHNNDVWDQMADWAEEQGYDPDDLDQVEPERIDWWAFEYLEDDDVEVALWESENDLDLHQQMLRVFESKLAQHREQHETTVDYAQ